MLLDIVTHVAAVIGGGVFSYLFLRANAKKKAILDAWVEVQSQKLKDK